MQVDARRLAEAGDHPAIADSMISLPSPFLPEDAEAWIALTLERSRVDGYVIADDLDGAVVGAAELREIELEHRQAEASFWDHPRRLGTRLRFGGAPSLDANRF